MGPDYYLVYFFFLERYVILSVILVIDVQFYLIKLFMSLIVLIIDELNKRLSCSCLFIFFKSTLVTV